MFCFSVLDEKKIQYLMREGGKKHTLNLFLEKVGDAIKKKIHLFF